ncbi:MAG: CPXCG motif-containing cysteine-rich protein [Roseibacillus sp.]|nr:CPXCG motif-containing cysteine-rich protein [Roseibacillus sp.]
MQCPSCFEYFAVSIPPVVECPTNLDYDCEVCCRPMVIVVDEEGAAQAQSMDDALSG